MTYLLLAEPKIILARVLDIRPFLFAPYGCGLPLLVELKSSSTDKSHKKRPKRFFKKRLPIILLRFVVRVFLIERERAVIATFALKAPSAHQESLCWLTIILQKILYTSRSNNTMSKLLR